MYCLRGIDTLLITMDGFCVFSTFNANYNKFLSCKEDVNHGFSCCMYKYLSRAAPGSRSTSVCEELDRVVGGAPYIMRVNVFEDFIVSGKID